MGQPGYRRSNSGTNGEHQVQKKGTKLIVNLSKTSMYIVEQKIIKNVLIFVKGRHTVGL